MSKSLMVFFAQETKELGSEPVKVVSSEATYSLFGLKLGAIAKGG